MFKLHDESSSLIERGFLSRKELEVLGSVTPGLSGSTSTQDADIIDAATHLSNKKMRDSRREQIERAPGGSKNVLTSAAEVMRRKNRGMSIVGEAALLLSNKQTDLSSKSSKDAQIYSPLKGQSADVQPLEPAIL